MQGKSPDLERIYIPADSEISRIDQKPEERVDQEAEVTVLR